MEFLRQIIDTSWIPEFLVLIIAVGISLWLVAGGLGPPFDTWLRRLGIFITTVTIGILVAALLFGVDLQFRLPDYGWKPAPKSPAKKSLKAPSQEPAGTRGAQDLRLESGPGERQPEAAGKNLSPKDVPKGSWYEVGKWEGSGPKQTEAFHVTSLWMVGWNTVSTSSRPAFFSIKVYRSDGKFIRDAAKALGEDFDRTFIKGSGTYYLVIDTTQKYTVIVKAKKEDK